MERMNSWMVIGGRVRLSRRGPVPYPSHYKGFGAPGSMILERRAPANPFDAAAPRAEAANDGANCRVVEGFRCQGHRRGVPILFSDGNLRPAPPVPPPGGR